MRISNYNTIAQNYNLWITYVDPSGLMTKEEFEATPIVDKVKMIRDCFGEEE